MKAFSVSYDSPGRQGYGPVIAEDKEQVREILELRLGTKDIQLRAYEISFDKVNLSQLTAGDLLRLLKQ